jgi:hypothetical protein
MLLVKAIKKTLYKIFTLTIRDKIPPPPRGLATHYEHMTDGAARVAARLGIRSPDALPAALRRANAESVDELVQALDHFQPRRKIARRAAGFLIRLMRSQRGHPHLSEILRFEREKRQPHNAIVQERLNKVRRWRD